MRKRIYSIFLLLICMTFLLVGCGKVRDIAEEILAEFQTERDEKESTDEESETTETEFSITSAYWEEEVSRESTGQSEAYTPTDGNVQSEVSTPTESVFDEEDVLEKDTFDYVALGNSVTCNKKDGELWWGNWGMAATEADKDYVHLVADWLGEQCIEPVTTTVLDLKQWEVSKNRDKILKYYRGYFDEDTDLVTIQTGENITEFKETLETDYMSFIKFIREEAPNAQILMLGEVLWPAEDIENAKKKACESYGVTFVDMKEFLKEYEKSYRSSVGIKVKGADGKNHKITNEVVAAHPNNKGMKCIAKLVIDKIEMQF